MLARHEKDPVEPRAGEFSERADGVRVCRQYALQSRQGIGFGATKGGVVRRAALPRGPVELEGVSVQDKVGRATAFRVERLQKQREFIAPAEILLDVPRPRLVPAGTHVQIGDDRDEPG